LHVERIINEPTAGNSELNESSNVYLFPVAAALAYGLEQIKGDAPSNIMIFDLGTTKQRGKERNGINLICRWWDTGCNDFDN
jgi:hypothetical protein